MRRALASFVLAAAALGCTAPDYGNGHLQCAPSGACPSGFYCATDQRCWLDGSGPSGNGGDGGVPDLAAPADFAGVTLDLASIDLGGGPSKCAGSSALLCENFEGSLATNGWLNDNTTGCTATIDTTRAFRGSSSLKSHIAASAAMTSPHAVIDTIKPYPILGIIYGRVWAYFSPSLPSMSSQYEQFFNFTATDGSGVSVATDTGNVTLDDYAGTMLYVRSSTPMPLDRWTCIQFIMSEGSATGALSVSVDGVPLQDLTGSGPTPTIDKLYLGLDFASPNNSAIPAYDAWFDELIVDNKQVGCSD